MSGSETAAGNGCRCSTRKTNRHEAPHSMSKRFPNRNRNAETPEELYQPVPLKGKFGDVGELEQSKLFRTALRIAIGLAIFFWLAAFGLWLFGKLFLQ